MSDAMRVVLEVGPKGKRMVAGALDWPGLDRWGKDEEQALANVHAYRSRYLPVAERAGMGDAFARADRVDVVERYQGNTSTDWWGIAHVPSETERQVLPSDELERRLSLLSACWTHFEEVSERVSAELRLGPRGGGWTRDEIIRHVHVNEAAQFARKVGVHTPHEVMLAADAREAHRAATLDAIRAYNAEGRIAGRSWPIQFLIRRIAQHVMDHAWEMEDRDLSA